MTTSSSMPGESSVPQQPPEAVSGSRPNHRDWALPGLALATLTLLLTLLGLGVMGFFHLENRIDTRFDRLDEKTDTRFGQLEEKMDTRFGQMDTRFGQLDSKMDARFGQFEEKMEARFGQLQDLILSLHQARQAPAIE